MNQHGDGWRNHICRRAGASSRRRSKGQARSPPLTTHQAWHSHPRERRPAAPPAAPQQPTKATQKAAPAAAAEAARTAAQAAAEATTARGAGRRRSGQPGGPAKASSACGRPAEKLDRQQGRQRRRGHFAQGTVRVGALAVPSVRGGVRPQRSGRWRRPRLLHRQRLPPQLGGQVGPGGQGAAELASSGGSWGAGARHSRWGGSGDRTAGGRPSGAHRPGPTSSGAGNGTGPPASAPRHPRGRVELAGRAGSGGSEGRCCSTRPGCGADPTLERAHGPGQRGSADGAEAPTGQRRRRRQPSRQEEEEEERGGGGAEEGQEEEGGEPPSVADEAPQALALTIQVASSATAQRKQRQRQRPAAGQVSRSRQPRRSVPPANKE